MMRRTLLALTCAGMFAFTNAHANISEDLSSNLSTVDVLSNALSHCITPDAGNCTVIDIEALMFDVAAIDVELLDSFVTAGIESGLDAITVVEAAIKAGANPEAVTQAAILAGADPTDVAAATAAGGPTATGPNAIPGQTGTTVSPPPFGNNAGSGGGGNPSPT
ncbi:hypothetical protein [Neptuniibacter marinus]|uniref:hypothetical protein n=1 Tax=Neptuniibacter marinus TaxID=1806670 RepID=UPI0012E80FB1|nr:hypothetical protein [Neptuniibacter marinus]